jgi:hypothetical protein
MFGKKDSTFRRDHFWGSHSTKISNAHIELNDEKNTIISFARESDSKDVKYPEATSLVITRNLHNGDLMLNYYKDDRQLAQEIIYGHIISRLRVEFA